MGKNNEPTRPNDKLSGSQQDRKPGVVKPEHRQEPRHNVSPTGSEFDRKNQGSKSGGYTAPGKQDDVYNKKKTSPKNQQG